MTVSPDGSSSDRFSGAAAAAAELNRARSSVRPGLRWHVYELLAAAVFVSCTVFVYGMYRPQLQLWLLISIPLLGAFTALTAWRRRIVGRPEAHLARIATVAAILLLVATMTLLSQLSTDGRSVWAMAGISVLPAIPLVAATLRIVSR